MKDFFRLLCSKFCCILHAASLLVKGDRMDTRKDAKKFLKWAGIPKREEDHKTMEWEIFEKKKIPS